MFYLYFSLAFMLTIVCFCLCKYVFFKKSEKFNLIINKILKIAVVVYCCIVFLSILLPDAFTLCCDQEELAPSLNEKLFAVLRWFSTLSFIMLPLAIFFKNKTIRNIAIYFCTVVTIVSIINYPTYMEYFTSIAGKGLNSIPIFSQSFKNFLLNQTFRSFVIGFQWFLELSIPIILAITEKHLFNFKNKKEYLYFFAVLIPTLLGCIPIYVPQHIWGYSNIIFSAWSISHVLWILIVIAEIIVLFYIFRNKSIENKLILCLILSLSLVLQYSQMFGAISIKLEKLPLQLCNLGAYFILISLITRNKHIFNFTVIVNVVGVIFALAQPDLLNKGLFYLYNMHFIFEHSNVIIIPILAMLLNLFPRLTKQTLKDCLIGFSTYFVFVLFLGTLFNSIQSITGNAFYHANYMFMFDKAKAIKLLPFLEPVFNITIKVGQHVTFYPVVQISVYVVFVGVCVGMYYFIQLIYKIKDKITARKQNITETKT